MLLSNQHFAAYLRVPTGTIFGSLFKPEIGLKINPIARETFVGPIKDDLTVPVCSCVCLRSFFVPVIILYQKADRNKGKSRIILLVERREKKEKKQ